jgi:hypothetical protein
MNRKDWTPLDDQVVGLTIQMHPILEENICFGHGDDDDSDDNDDDDDDDDDTRQQQHLNPYELLWFRL